MRAFAPLLLLLPAPALAHPGAHGDATLWHALTQPDHLGWAVLALAGAAVAWSRWRA